MQWKFSETQLFNRAVFMEKMRREKQQEKWMKNNRVMECSHTVMLLNCCFGHWIKKLLKIHIKSYLVQLQLLLTTKVSQKNHDGWNGKRTPLTTDREKKCIFCIDVFLHCIETEVLKQFCLLSLSRLWLRPSKRPKSNIPICRWQRLLSTRRQRSAQISPIGEVSAQHQLCNSHTSHISHIDSFSMFKSRLKIEMTQLCQTVLFR